MIVVLTGAAIAMAQGDSHLYHPAVPNSTTVVAGGGYGGGYYGNGGASTAAGSAMNGMASVISAKGDYNLSTSAAAVNMTQAQKNEIQNRQQWTNTYFDMRATNRQARAAEAGPPPTMEQIVRMAQSGVPKPISPSQIDPMTGKIDWPGPLQLDAFAPQRDVMNEIVTKQTTLGSLGYSDKLKADETIDAMFAQLKTMIRDVPTAQYMASRDFLRSLLYATTKNQLN